jgi:hypothetical protein
MFNPMRTWSVALILAIYLVSITTGQSQTIPLTEAGILTKRQAALRIIATTVHRETMKTEEFLDKRRPPRLEYGFTKEFEPPNRFHVIFQSNLGGKVQTSEVMLIGSKGYSRVKGEAWRRDPEASVESGSPIPPDEGNSSIPDVSVDYKPQVKIGSRKADLYVVKKQYRHGSGGTANVNSYTHRYWFDDQDRLLKTEFESSSTRSPSFVIRTSIYEYDFDISIEAPSS